MQIDICTPQRSLTFVGMLTELVKQWNILINCMHECENLILFSIAFGRGNMCMHLKCNVRAIHNILLKKKFPDQK